MKTGVMIVALFALLSACATSPSGASRSAAPASPGETPGGTWVGTISGLDMATASGLAEAPARLTLDRDGSWTLTSSGGFAATGAVRRAGAGLLLDGTVTSGDPMTVGRTVSFVLKPRGPGALYGDAETFFQGHRIDAGIGLRLVTWGA